MIPQLRFPRVMEEKQYLGLSPHDQEEYLEKKIREIVEMNEHGITRGDIQRNTAFSRPSIIKHLEKIVASREAYKIRRGRAEIYYPKGKPDLKNRIETETELGSHYRATFLNNEFGQFIYIEDLDTRDISGGSIMLKKEDIENFNKFVGIVLEKTQRLRAGELQHEIVRS